MKPVFKQTEIFFDDPTAKPNFVNLGKSNAPVEVVVKYAGKKCELYEVGETVLLDLNRAVDLKFGDEKLKGVLYEHYILCGISDAGQD